LKVIQALAQEDLFQVDWEGASSLSSTELGECIDEMLFSSQVGHRPQGASLDGLRVHILALTLDELAFGGQAKANKVSKGSAVAAGHGHVCEKILCVGDVSAASNYFARVTEVSQRRNSKPSLDGDWMVIVLVASMVNPHAWNAYQEEQEEAEPEVFKHFQIKDDARAKDVEVSLPPFLRRRVAANP